MKAIVQVKYGSPENVLQLREIQRPAVGDDDVLVRVKAASLHPDVWHVVAGWPFILRLMGAGLFKPKDLVPGTDMAGLVESVGRNVTRFRPGDEVFGETLRGMQWRNGGAFAEYVSIPQDVIALKPKGISFEQAAAIPTSGYIALFNLKSGARVKPGQNVLVNGACGGVGSIAMQLAKAYGAMVTAVDRADKAEMAKSFGADRFIDYAQEDFTRRDERYDLIFDVASNLSFRDCKRALSPAGIYVLIGHDHFGSTGGRIFGSVPRLMKLAALSLFTKQLPAPEFSMPDKKDTMNVLKNFLEEGRLTPVIDKVYSLDRVPEAFRYMQSGQAKGKIIITP